MNLGEINADLDGNPLLIDAFASRKSRNPNYSLRAFAKFLGISKTALSAVLSGRRRFSRKAVETISRKLMLSPAQKNIFSKQMQDARTNNHDNTDQVDVREYLLLQEDRFKLISDWFYMGVLLLAQLPDHKADAKWIADRLGISEIEAHSALGVLARLGLIDIRAGRIVRTSPAVSVPGGKPSESIRKYHRQNLRKAEIALDEEPVSRRIFNSICIPTRPERLKEAARIMDEFQEKMSALASDDRATDIYTLAIQFFPITKQENKT